MCKLTLYETFICNMNNSQVWEKFISKRRKVTDKGEFWRVWLREECVWYIYCITEAKYKCEQCVFEMKYQSAGGKVQLVETPAEVLTLNICQLKRRCTPFY